MRISRWRFVLLALAIVAAALFFFRAWGDPDAMVMVHSDAVRFTPTETIDLAALAVPRYGVTPTGQTCRVCQSASKGLSDIVRVNRQDPDPVSQGIGVAAAIAVHIRLHGGVRRHVATRARLTLLETPIESTPDRCIAAVELVYRPDSTSAIEQRLAFEDTLRRTTPLSLELQFPSGVPLRRFKVRSLGFITGETRTTVSAVRAGSLRFPKFGDDSVTLFVGDSLSLGSLVGVVLELDVGRTIRTVYRGTVTAPKVNNVDVEPNLGRQLLSNKLWNLLATLLIAVMTAVVPFFEKAVTHRAKQAESPDPKSLTTTPAGPPT
jgi:hypothetical protein